MARASDKSAGFPSSLKLADGWAKEMGKKTERGEAFDSDGNKIPVLLVYHGPRPVWVRELKKCIVIFTQVEFEADLIKKLKGIKKALRDRIYTAMIRELLSNARTGFVFAPPSAKSLLELNSVRIEQVIKISKADSTSFNRYADAIQEVVTVTTRGFSLLGPVLSAATASKESSEDIGAPPGMYV